MNAEQAKKLREPFPADLIGKLPKPTKKDNPKGRCPECKGWHGLPAVHLDYVGHAAVTDRLLSVDPDWHWAPLARDPNTGGPILVPNQGGLGDEPLGLWGNLTVCGVTKPAFGGGKNAKECISDLIRNGAMRFGVGLDLWSKEDLHVDDDNKNAGETEGAAAPEPGAAGAAPAPSPAEPELHSVEWWDALTPEQITALVPRVADAGLLRDFAEYETNRRPRLGKNARRGVGAFLQARIQELEGNEPKAEHATSAVADNRPGGRESVSQNGEMPVAESASSPLQELQACLAFIAEQPGAVDNASFWTQTNVLVGLSASGAGEFKSLAEVPAEWVVKVLEKVPAEVRRLVATMGPESQAALAAQVA